MIENKTLEYYNTNSYQFNTNTVNVPFSSIQSNFLSYLPKQAYILDFGCGSGRDSKAFISSGYRVDAIDGSIEMCKLSEALIGQPVNCIRFQDFCVKNKYDGIWACASILHLDHDELRKVFKSLYDALKKEGYLYASFKYGTFAGIRDGRYFTDMTEDTFNDFVKETGLFEIVDMKVGSDSRPGREDELWLNTIMKKVIVA